MHKQHSIVKTGNFNTDFKLLTHNRYSVLNGHFVRQIHPSSFVDTPESYSAAHSKNCIFIAHKTLRTVWT